MDAAKARIESLNPLVAVETFHDAASLEGDALDNLIKGVDMVCVTDSDRASLVRQLPPRRLLACGDELTP